jgi:hypothetical protein
MVWYAAATGGSALYTGASFTTPAIAATTTYYVAAETTWPSLFKRKGTSCSYGNRSACNHVDWWKFYNDL